MAKYLRAVEASYDISFFRAGEGEARARIAEAMTAYEYQVQKKRVSSNGIGKVILLGSVDRSIVEDLIDIIKYTHPLGKHPHVNALPTPHERYVGEVHTALCELGESHEWDLELLNKVYRQVADADYRFNGVWAKLTWNRDKTCAIGVEWRTGHRLELGFVIKFSNGTSHWLPFLESPIGLGKIEAAAGKLVWQDNEVAILWHSNKRDYWRIEAGTLKVEFVYAPAEEGNAHGQYALGQMYLDGNLWVKRDEQMARYWLGKSAEQNFARAKRLLANLPNT